MAIVFACPCGKQFSVDDSKAGKRGRCSACGQEIVIPVSDPVIIPIEDEPIAVVVDSIEPSPPPLPPSVVSPVSSSTVKTDAALRDRSSARPPVEPWYYGFLTFIGYIFVIVGIGQMLLWLFIITIILVAAEDAVADKAAPVSLAFAIGSTVSLVTLVFFGGVILLAVDAGRNLRAIRWRGLD